MKKMIKTEGQAHFDSRLPGQKSHRSKPLTFYDQGVFTKALEPKERYSGTLMQ